MRKVPDDAERKLVTCTWLIGQFEPWREAYETFRENQSSTTKKEISVIAVKASEVPWVDWKDGWLTVEDYYWIPPHRVVSVCNPPKSSGLFA